MCLYLFIMCSYCPPDHLLSSDPAHHVLPRGVQGGVDVPRGDLHAPGERGLQDLPRPGRVGGDEKISR